MNKKIIFPLLILYSFVLGATKISNFTAQDINYKRVSFSDLKGEKLTMIDFWATWCKPCLQAIPKLRQIHDAFIDKGVHLVGINVDSPRNSAKVKPFAKTYKIDYPVLRDPNSKLARTFNVSAYPTLFIVNSDNQIVYTHIGFKIGDEIIIENELNKLLREN